MNFSSDIRPYVGRAADLVGGFAFPVPFLVICELLGLPVEERETFRSLASARFDVTYGGSGAFGAISGSREYLLEFTRRQRLDPGEGLVGQIVREHGDEVSDFDLAGLADGVRARLPPVRRRRAGPHGAADRLPGAGPPLSGPPARHRPPGVPA